MSSVARPMPSRDEALRRVNRLFPRRRQWIALSGFLVVVLAAWGGWWLIHRHVMATLQLGFMDGSVQWSLGNGSWSHGGFTEVNLKGRYMPRYLPKVARANPIAPLADLHRVEVLDLSDCLEVRSSDLAVLGKLPHLRVLHLGRTDYPWMRTEPDARHLDGVAPTIGRLTRLEELDLSGSDLTDAGVRSLAGLTRLETLDLSRTHITDAGLKSVADLPRLRELRLDGTQISNEAASALARRRPALVIDHPVFQPPPIGSPTP